MCMFLGSPLESPLGTVCRMWQTKNICVHVTFRCMVLETTIARYGVLGFGYTDQVSNWLWRLPKSQSPLFESHQPRTDGWELLTKVRVAHWGMEGHSYLYARKGEKSKIQLTSGKPRMSASTCWGDSGLLRFGEGEGKQPRWESNNAKERERGREKEKECS